MNDAATGNWNLPRPILAGALLLSSVLIWAAAPKAKAEVSGPHERTAALVLDGKFLEEGSGWTEEGCVYWEGDTGTAVVVDLGEFRLIQDLVLQVDNNDTYAVETSADGKSYRKLLTVLAEYGEIDGGMDTFSTVKGDGEYEARIDFRPLNARYVRLTAVSGDAMYSVSEIQVISEPTKK